jgi:hypothetical protein
MVCVAAARLATAEATAALQQRVTDKMTTLQAVEKKATEAHGHVHDIALLLGEEQSSAIALEVETAVTALQLASTTASSFRAPPPPPSGGDLAVVAMLHAQACGVQNIRSLVLTVLDPSSTRCAHCRDQVLLTLKRYELIDHVVSNALPIKDPAWDRMETMSSPGSSPRSTTSPRAKSGT